MGWGFLDKLPAVGSLSFLQTGCGGAGFGGRERGTTPRPCSAPTPIQLGAAGDSREATTSLGLSAVRTEALPGRGRGPISHPHGGSSGAGVCVGGSPLPPPSFCPLSCQRTGDSALVPPVRRPEGWMRPVGGLCAQDAPASRLAGLALFPVSSTSASRGRPWPVSASGVFLAQIGFHGAGLLKRISALIKYIKIYFHSK